MRIISTELMCPYGIDGVCHQKAKGFCGSIYPRPSNDHCLQGARALRDIGRRIAVSGESVTVIRTDQTTLSLEINGRPRAKLVRGVVSYI